MSKIIQLVQGGVVANVLQFDDTAVLSGGVLTVGGMPFAAPAGGTFMQQDGARKGWELSGGVLVAPTVIAPTLTADELVAYANAKQWALATGGHTVTVGGAAYLFPSDVTSMALMTGKVLRLQLPSAPTTVDWQLPSGFVTFAAADFITASAAIADFVQSTFAALQPVLAAIAAATMTTTAQIDAASWPTP